MEDKIRDLCAKVVASKNDGDITPMLVGFRVALHPHVEYRQPGPVIARQQDRVVAVVRLQHFESGLPQTRHDRGQHQPVVVDHQDPGRSRSDCPVVGRALHCVAFLGSWVVGSPQR